MTAGQVRKRYLPLFFILMSFHFVPPTPSWQKNYEGYSCCLDGEAVLGFGILSNPQNRSTLGFFVVFCCKLEKIKTSYALAQKMALKLR